MKIYVIATNLLRDVYIEKIGLNGVRTVCFDFKEAIQFVRKEDAKKCFTGDPNEYVKEIDL